MSYSQFETLEQTLDAFDLTPIEAQFFPYLSPIAPSDLLTTFLKRSVPIVLRQVKKRDQKESFIPFFWK